ncbi:MAG: redoxin domain-containing protein [Ilumatobacter sp.]|uniref:TlpA family protein disulfide reductase n=1 Tax=Ilumatobacter sp. TaxID=1967498 RepID=UPI00329A3191
MTTSVDELTEPASTGGRSGGRLAPFIALGIAVALIGLVVLFIGADPDAPAPQGASPLLGKPAPEAVGELDDGTPFDLSRRKGSWVVLNFFQSSCIPCIAEHPELVEFVDQQAGLGAQGAEFYSVVTGDTRANVEAFFEREGGDWPAIYSDGDQITVAFGVAQVPETWIIDPRGVVQARFQGEVTAEVLSVTIQQIREGIR